MRAHFHTGRELPPSFVSPMSPRKSKYPFKDDDVRGFTLDNVPNALLDAALNKAHATGTSLRVVLIDYLFEYVEDIIDAGQESPPDS